MKSYSSIDAYLADVPQEKRAPLEMIRGLVKELAPDAVESISYGMPAYKFKGKPLVYFAAFKNHLSFFPASGSVLKQFEEELESFSVSKGTVRFTVEKPLPKSLLKKIILVRLRENEMAATKKKK